jgi:hypothetical protein
MDNYNKDEMPKGGHIKEPALTVDEEEDLEKKRDFEQARTRDVCQGERDPQTEDGRDQ